MTVSRFHIPQQDHSPSAEQPAALRSYGWASAVPGPSLLIFGAVHGNEQSGTHAIRRWIERFESGQVRLKRGRLTMVPVANPKAFIKNEREGDRNLNRNFVPQAQPQNFEDHMVNALAPLLESHDALLDLHSYSGEGRAFAMTGPLNNTGTLEPFARQQEEEAFAKAVGLPIIVQGWLEVYEQAVKASGGALRPEHGIGTNEFMRSRGGYAITVESGSHEEPQAIEVADRCIAGVLNLLEMADVTVEPVAQYTTHHMRQVFMRQSADDRMQKEWQNFDPFRQGDLLATRADGSQILAPFDGCVIFPQPDAAVNREWFYLAQTDHS
ncbi:succinylglutamate desuccinylase/aspartoacylase family protein [Comamonas sp. JNW]|uniref:succinylglutamate desuccinylase/aspartoacylase family protein n=1 Tax=Comamonas sp. JNW TaxID=2170731 RepID=UPI000DE73CCE|nr:succinylglutamate desuccinylase/aspartoacylase family protein [Comamonas sp. JNW]PWB14724.1 succinylglutamate desuccinylase [Comamonas sp. JNW]